MEQPTMTRERAAERSDYRVLHKYLRDRYAHMVVLTFGQIEDLLGAPLPQAARSTPTWWTGAGPDDAPLPLADAWIQAKRSAVPNLPAQIVRFERISM
jgi:hypothetical protein